MIPIARGYCTQTMRKLKVIEAIDLSWTDVRWMTSKTFIDRKETSAKSPKLPIPIKASLTNISQPQKVATQKMAEMPASTFFFCLILCLTPQAPEAYSPSPHGSVSSRRVPGCPDLEAFQTISSLDHLNSEQLNKITCLCGPEYSNDQLLGGKEATYDDQLISITCIYGTKIADLRGAIELVAKSNKSVGRIFLDHVDFAEVEGTSSQKGQFLSGPHFANLTQLEIKKCRGNPYLNFEANSIANFNSLVELVIEECNLEKMPTKLIAKAPKLRRLSLANNKMSALGKADFAGLQMVETLNIAGNLLSSSVENGSLSQLTNIKNLMIGEHNFASSTLLMQIGQLETLESLDMSQMDGILSTEQFETFQNLSKLKRFILSGCNLKLLNTGGFAQFPALEWLDLRVNLIERLMDEPFKGLHNLQFLSLAGNFIRELPNKLWQDLPALQSLEIGWNDLRKLNGTSFGGMGKRLRRLDVRNNEALREIEPDTFVGLDQLRYLNISGTLLAKVSAKVFNLPNLKELDLSSSNISSIEMEQNDTQWAKSSSPIEWLNLSKNKLKTLEVTLLDGMNALKVLDLSENRWLCDEKMQKIVRKVDALYKSAANEKHEFELRNSEGTKCERPFTRKGASVFELLRANASELEYDERADTTPTNAKVTQTTTTAPIDPGGVLFGKENATIDWKSMTLFVGSDSNEHLNFTALESELEDGRRPKYDINAVKYGEKSVTKKEANSLLSGVVVTLLVISTAFCIIIVARRKADGKTTERAESAEKADDGGEKERESDRRPNRRRGEGTNHFEISTF